MGAIGGLVGLSGGASGSGFAAPQNANIQSPVTQAQLTGAQAGTTGAQGQAGNAYASQQALLQALQGQQGLGNQQQIYNQLQGIASGTGPNPAQAQLAQNTQANVSNQAALMAGQRGAAANAGLIARQAAQQGAATQQQAVGQAATLQAQQALGALGQAGNLATTQAGQQIAQTNANTAAAQNQQGLNQAQQANLLGAQTQQNAQQVAMQSNVNNANAGLANTVMQGQQGVIGGLMQGAGTAVKGLLGAEGGQVPMMADGGDPGASSGAQSQFGRFLSGVGGAMEDGMAQTPGAKALQKGSSSLFSGLTKGLTGSGGSAGASLGDSGALGGSSGVAMPGAATLLAAKGGRVPVVLSPGERRVPPEKAEAIASGQESVHTCPKVPGTPKVKGNSYSNDTYKTTERPGTIIVPNEELQKKDSESAAAKFVAATLAKKKVKA